VFGGLVTPVVLAIAGVLPGLGAVYFSSGAYGTALTHEAYSRNYFRIGDNAYMRSRAVARMMAEDYPTSPNWGGIVVDSETGHSAFNSFVSGMKEFFHTATLNPPVLTSFGATDYKSQIYALLNQNLDGLFIAVYGNDEVTFLQQASGLGLTQKLKVAVDLGAGDEVLNALRGRVPAEYWTGTHWYYGLYPDVAMSTKLVADYGARKSGETPDGFVGEGHASVYAIAAGLRKAGSTATEAFITAMEGLTIDTDKGPRTVRKEDHQAVCDLNFMRISRSDAPHGWSVTKGRKIDGGLVIEPPSPGKALVL
jgi:branched-chain amino acid transport system substrate-binding protein